MAKSEFRRQVEDAIQARHSKVHPWSEAWVAGRLNRRLLGEWTKQHYHYVDPTVRLYGRILSNCPDDEARALILESLNEEEGVVGTADFKAAKHADLLLQFGEHCGMSREEIKRAPERGEVLPETLGLQSWCYRQSHRPFVEALATIFVGLESQVPQIYARTTPPLIEKYGFTEAEVTFFQLHIVADTEHGERGFEILERHATTSEIRAKCLRLVREATMMRRLYLDGLYRKYLAVPQAAAAE